MLRGRAKDSAGILFLLPLNRGDAGWRRPRRGPDEFPAHAEIQERRKTDEEAVNRHVGHDQLSPGQVNGNLVRNPAVDSTLLRPGIPRADLREVEIQIQPTAEGYQGEE